MCSSRSCGQKAWNLVRSAATNELYTPNPRGAAPPTRDDDAAAADEVKDDDGGPPEPKRTPWIKLLSKPSSSSSTHAHLHNITPHYPTSSHDNVMSQSLPEVTNKSLQSKTSKSPRV